MILEAGKSKICTADALVQLRRLEAAVEPGRGSVPVEGCQAGGCFVTQGRVSLWFYSAFN